MGDILDLILAAGSADNTVAPAAQLLLCTMMVSSCVVTAGLNPHWFPLQLRHCIIKPERKGQIQSCPVSREHRHSVLHFCEALRRARALFSSCNLKCHIVWFPVVSQGPVSDVLSGNLTGKSVEQSRGRYVYSEQLNPTLLINKVGACFSSMFVSRRADRGECMLMFVVMQKHLFPKNILYSSS